MIENSRKLGSHTDHHIILISFHEVIMSITTTGNLGPMILQSLAPAMLYVPTSAMNYITICDKVSMPVNGGTTCRFMRPRALTPPTIQLGNSGIDKPRRVDVKPSLIDLDILAA